MRSSELVTLEKEVVVYRGLKSKDSSFDIFTYDYDKAIKQAEASLLIVKIMPGVAIIPMPNSNDILIPKNHTMIVKDRKIKDDVNVYNILLEPKIDQIKYIIKDKIKEEDIERYGIEDSINMVINSMDLKVDSNTIEELKGEMED